MSPDDDSIVRHAVHAAGTLRRLARRGALALSTLVLASGCARSPAPEADQVALRQVQGPVVERMELELDEAPYLRARLLPGPPPGVAELERVYRDFLFLPDGRRRDSDYVYLNVYDAGGRFQYQLAHDPAVGRVVRNTTEHY
jgi:hypothetical protein